MAAAEEVSKGLQDFIILSKYARHISELKRRETWVEAITRVRDMHLTRFAKLPQDDINEITWAFDMAAQKRVLPSMRSVQFGGPAVLAHNARLFNCSVRFVDSIRAFAEIAYLMLCGCGTGIGVYKKYLNRLPDLVGPDDRTGTVINYVVEDNIEGWCDSLEALLSCYTKNNAMSGRKISFDYSRIRRKGSLLKTGGGKAPGHVPLKNAHTKIKNLITFLIEDRNQTRLKSIDVVDVLLHFADAVLSGGVRRTASSVMFEPDDEDMMSAKTYFKVKKFRGVIDEETNEWHGKIWYQDKQRDVVFKLKDSGDKWEYETNLLENKIVSWRFVEPQRARSNNSVRLLRNSCTLEQFKDIIDKTRQYGEPGFVFCNSEDTLMNPCQPKDSLLLTREGISKLGDINVGDEIWSSEGWTKVTKKWSTGIQKVFQFKTTAGIFCGTDTHRILSAGEKIEVKDAESIDTITGPYEENLDLFFQDIMDGIVLGDGSVHKASNNLVYLCVGKDDTDYFESEIKHLLKRERPGLHDGAWEVETTITADELPLTFQRKVPDRFLYGNRNKICGFLRGLYTANGSICGPRVTLKAASFKIIENVQAMLSSVGIRSYYTTNKPTVVQFENGAYECKESYDLNISTDIDKFEKIIGFIQDYKKYKLAYILQNKTRKGRVKSTYDIISKELVSEEETFHITVDNDSHTYWTQCCDVSNCFEISFIPVTITGECGVQFCNLTSINGARVTSKEDFKNCVRAETIIGTLQASYTDFKYLSRTAKQLTDEEALLGNSITGILDTPDIILDDEFLAEMAEYAYEVNLEWSKKLGVNPAARINCVKPEGTGSLAVGSAPGIHAHHSRKYFRRIQNSLTDNIHQYFKLHNPHMVEESVWNTNTKEEVVTFPIEVKKGAMVKKDLSALQHLEMIKRVQQNWVVPSQKNNKKDISHNVSCTVIVKEDEWESVIGYIYDNRDFFSAVSFLPEMGDKLFPQAPFEAVVTEEDEERFRELVENYVPVDYTKMVENSDGTMFMAESSCAGGACLI
jgi:hypothetical protein